MNISIFSKDWRKCPIYKALNGVIIENKNSKVFHGVREKGGKMEILFEDLNLKNELLDYVQELEAEGKSLATVKNYKLWINQFLDYVETVEDSAINYIQPVSAPNIFTGKIEIVEHGKIIIRKLKLIATRYRDFLGKKNKSTSVNSKIIALNGFFKFCNILEKDKRGRMEIISVKTVEVQKKHSIEDSRLLELSDYYKLLDSARAENDLRALALFQLLFNTGARISEALSIKIEQIEKISAAEYKVSIIGKRKKIRDLDFNAEVLAAIENYLLETSRSLNSTGFLFQTYKNFEDGFHRLSPKMADLTVKKYARKINLPRTKFFSHNFRHLIARTLLENGTSIDKVKNFLGHTNISTTALYTMGKASELRREKSLALRKARIEILKKKYNSETDSMILELIATDPEISDSKIAQNLGISKATFSRKYKNISVEIRKEF